LSTRRMRLSLVLFWCAVGLGQVARYDLLLKGGHVIDQKNQIDAVMDVAVQAGRIAAIGANLDSAIARKIVDAHGLYVTPALIDIHVHVFYTGGVPNAWAGDNSVQPDAFSFRTGVTTMVDAGSAGYRNFDVFRATVIDRAKTRVLAMINIAGYGMLTDATEQDTSDMLPEKVAAVASRNRDVVVGIKSAHYEKPDWTSVDRAIEAGALAGLPVMVDFGYFLPERPYWQLVTQKLRPGDISTHMFRGPVPYVDDNGILLDYLKRARARGVKFDVGHGGGSFVMRSVVPAISNGFYPDSISTDLHNGSMNAAMMDMPTVISKLMAAGLPLQETVLRSTWNPAQIIHRTDLGHLSIGAPADIAVWNLAKGEFGFQDGPGGKIDGTQRLLCEMTLKAGRIEWDWNARAGTPYQKLPRDYGIRKGIDTVVKP